MNPGFRNSYFIVAFVTFLMHLFSATPISAMQCNNGAEVSKQEYCSFFYFYLNAPRPLDQRIGSRVGASSSTETRSIALVVGISSYPNIRGASISAAKNDVERLKTFLKQDQQFDEVIVLENQDATSENINYFLDVYLPQRVILYAKRSRFLFAYTGHGIPASGPVPASMVLSLANSMSDLANLYNLAHLRVSLENLAESNFHVLALINTCYGGSIFGPSMGGGNPSVSYEPGSYALTAGSKDAPVATFGGQKDGSIFFDKLIDGIISGKADKDYQTAVDLNGNVIQQGGVVRLGALTDYLSAELERIPPLSVAGRKAPFKPKAPWIGPVEPAYSRADGGFFFLSPIIRTAANVIAIPPGPVSSLPGRPDIKVFGAAEEYPIRGITVSQWEGEIDWDAVKESGISFAYIRAGSSRGKDPTFNNHWKETAKRDIDHGAYFVYSYCKSVAEQVEVIRSEVPNEPTSLPFALDVESYDFPGNNNPPDVVCAHKATDDQTKNRVFEFAEQIRALYGKTPILYGNRRTLAKLTGERFRGYMVWLASYTRTGEPKRSSLKLSGRNPWTIWQYSANRVVPGIGDRSDYNAFFGTPEQYALFKSGIGNIGLEAVEPRIVPRPTASTVDKLQRGTGTE